MIIDVWRGANLDWFVCVLSAIKPLICPWEETGVECNDMSDFPLGWLLGSQGTVSSEAKQPFSRSVLSQRKVTINDFFTLQSVSALLSPPSFCDNPWLGWWGFPRADNQKIYNVTELLEFTVLRVNFDGSFKPLHSDKFTIRPVRRIYLTFNEVLKT